MYSDLNQQQALYYPGVPMYSDMVKPGGVSDPFGYPPAQHLYGSRYRYGQTSYTPCTDSSCAPSRQSTSLLYPMHSTSQVGSLAYPFSRTGCLPYPSSTAAAASPYGYSLPNPATDQMLYTTARQSPYPSSSLPAYLPTASSLQDNQLLYSSGAAEAGAAAVSQSSYPSQGQQVSPYASSTAQMGQSSYTPPYQSQTSPYPSSASPRQLPYSYQQQDEAAVATQQQTAAQSANYRSYSPHYPRKGSPYDQQQQSSQPTSSLYSGTPPPQSFYPYYASSDSSANASYNMQQ